MEIIKSEYLNDDLIEGRLQNGLSYYIIKRKKYTSKLGLLSVNFGSTDNKFSVNGKVNYIKDGTAHLLEHLVFEHKDYNVIDKFNKLGASLNAYTNFRNTAYHFSTVDNYYSCLSALIDFVPSNYIKDETLELEKNIIYNEINMFLDNPQYRAFFNMLSNLVKKSPLNSHIVGTTSSVESITVKELDTIFNTFYVPSNMTFIGAGNVDEAKILEQLNSIKKKNIHDVKRYYSKDDTIVKKVIIKETMPVNKQFFCFGLKVNFIKEVSIKVEILFTIILEMLFSQSSNFYETLSLKGLIDNDFVTDFLSFKEIGIILLQGSTNNAEQVLDEILEVLKEVNSNVKKESFNIIKNKKFGKLLQSFNDLDFVANFQIDLLRNNVNFHEYFKILSELDYKDLDEILNSIKVNENFTISIINSKPS